MKKVKAEKRPVDLKAFVKRTALAEDCARFIDYDCIVEDETGAPIIFYMKLRGDTTRMCQAVRTVAYGKGARTQGLTAQARVFGFNPRNTIRADFCSATSMSREHPAQHQVICDFGKILSKEYEKHLPDTFGQHVKTVQKVLPDWTIKGTPFTSGIINKNSALKYHFDSGNFKKVYSNMVVFKKYCRGGHLAIPEYDLMLDCADNTVVFFDGQSILHGVTPFKIATGGFRFSVVYYSLQQMWNCQPLTRELARAKKVHMERERRRA